MMGYHKIIGALGSKIIASDRLIVDDVEMTMRKKDFMNNIELDSNALASYMILSMNGWRCSWKNRGVLY